MADHFRAYDYVVSHLNHPFDETLLKEVNRLVTEHTLAYKAPDAVAGEYTTEDMAAGDTVFGDHNALVARVPSLMASTERAIADGVHPMIVAARFHGYFEYLHPFRDGNGRTGRLMSNFILMRVGHPIVIIRKSDRQDYIMSLKQIREEGIDKVLEDAGFAIRQPGCSACLAMNDDKVPAGKYAVSTSNRNFEGRQGPGSRTILASPLVAAAAAVTGKITDPRELM